jgi:hypothetical protein
MWPPSVSAVKFCIVKPAVVNQLTDAGTQNIRSPDMCQGERIVVLADCAFEEIRLRVCGAILTNANAEEVNADSSSLTDAP